MRRIVGGIRMDVIFQPCSETGGETKIYRYIVNKMENRWTITNA